MPQRHLVCEVEVFLEGSCPLEVILATLAGLTGTELILTEDEGAYLGLDLATHLRAPPHNL